MLAVCFNYLLHGVKCSLCLAESLHNPTTVSERGHRTLPRPRVAAGSLFREALAASCTARFPSCLQQPFLANPPSTTFSHLAPTLQHLASAKQRPTAIWSAT